ncbi:MAG: nucleotidyltransferase family protein [Campylobacterales bacterium]|nr:nucleotidyltransferase family protein [Campylobacterales bacterium]
MKRALLLAAGLGTRLRPITDTIQKCLVPINGKPLIEYWLDTLSKAGIEEFLINTHYFAEQMKEYVENSKYKNNIVLVHEDELLLTGGTILANKSFFQNEPFLVVHADNLCLCDFTLFIEKHKNRPQHCDITMMTFETDMPKNCGIVDLDKNGVVVGFYEKVANPPSNLANGAVYIFEPSVIEYIESYHKKMVDLSTEVLPHYLNKMYTFQNSVYHRDIGTIQSYALAQIEILNLHF